MSWIAQALITGCTSFAATNLDDIVVLLLFFSQSNAKFRPYQIVAGQYLGFVALILVSLPGFFGGLVLPRAWVGLLGLVPIAIGLKQLINPEAESAQVQTIAAGVNSQTVYPSRFSTLFKWIAPQTYHVAAVTFANGGDNVGIYIPLFANSDLATLSVILVTFLILIAVWCYVAYQLTRHSLIARSLTRYGHAIVPFTLIGLGIYILIESHSYRVLLPVN